MGTDSRHASCDGSGYVFYKVAFIMFCKVNFPTSFYLEETLKRTKAAISRNFQDNVDNHCQAIVLEYVDLARIHFGSASAEKSSVSCLVSNSIFERTS